jgi:hypothetical protein
MLSYFGSNAALHKLALFLLINKRRDLARALNHVIKVVGSQADATPIIAAFCKDNGLFVIHDMYGAPSGYSFERPAAQAEVASSDELEDIARMAMWVIGIAGVLCVLVFGFA